MVFLGRNFELSSELQHRTIRLLFIIVIVSITI